MASCLEDRVNAEGIRKGGLNAEGIRKGGLNAEGVS